MYKNVKCPANGFVWVLAKRLFRRCCPSAGGGSMAAWCSKPRNDGVRDGGLMVFVNICDNKNDLLKVRIQLAGMGGMAGREPKTGR